MMTAQNRNTPNENLTSQTFHGLPSLRKQLIGFFRKQTTTRKGDMKGGLIKFPIGILYHEPESMALWQKGIIEDCVSSTGLFIKAETSDVALAWARKWGKNFYEG
ncbi:hypothetical protein [Rhizobium sp. BR 314]|uniref:hypothetical protein n=1 Tax=Rhizobium sp. BR 314 TaxID=3040013 RepID=UPI0039BFC1CC